MKTSTQPIAAEGWIWIALAIATAIALQFLDCETLAFLALLAALWLAFFFRNLERIPDERDPLVFIAPIDGQIKAIERAENGVKVVVKNRAFDSHILRAPAQGVMTIALRRGVVGRLSAPFDSLAQVETLSIGKAAIALKPNLFESRLYPAKRGGFLGERIGFFYGGEAAIALPLETELKIAIGDQIYAGQSLIGIARSES